MYGIFFLDFGNLPHLNLATKKISLASAFADSSIKYCTLYNTRACVKLLQNTVPRISVGKMLSRLLKHMPKYCMNTFLIFMQYMELLTIIPRFYDIKTKLTCTIPDFLLSEQNSEKCKCNIKQRSRGKSYNVH